tara:strand:+ start:579 stop:1370 length:792 start_codon:yes stop_codon:yes gene_type:complete
MKRNTISLSELLDKKREIGKDNLHKLKMSKSEPLLTIQEKDDIANCKTSVGKPIIDKYFTVDFEGDGPLGLVFNYNEQDKTMFIESVINGTLATEFEHVEPGIILNKINNRSVSSVSYEDNLSWIKYIWRKRSFISIEFRKVGNMKTKDPYQNIVNMNIFHLLKRVGCEYHYSDFIKLGAQRIEDFEFLEYDDLIKMNMNDTNIRNFCNEYSIQIPEKKKNNSGIFKIPSDPILNENLESLLTESEREQIKLDRLFASKFKKI